MKFFLFIFFSVLCFNIFSQVSENRYFIEFTDKNNNGYSIDRPYEFLSQRALERRAKQNISIDYSDLPVNNNYVDSLRNMGVHILNVSKWFNSVSIYTTDTDLIDTITNISFIKSNLRPPLKKKEEVVPPVTKSNYVRYRKQEFNTSDNYYDYGYSIEQIYMNNGQKLHNEGYRGKDMLIAVTDAGFTGLPGLPSFDSLYAENRVIATRNFVHGGNNVYGYGTHGMKVLSIIAANFPGNLIGSAPEASFVLLVSEDSDSETYIEEINWISAAEYADSIGADIINVSLGYIDFDTPEFDHGFSDLDGKTAIISRAATIAARKGIIVVSAAANNGNSATHPWIAAPADADNILTVGAVWANKTYASFSSRGPTADGRVKPDVVGMGAGTSNQGLDGLITRGNGTSYSAPLISGFVACLWQKFPDRTNMEIIDAVRRSSNYYNNPTDTLGYGIPDFNLASEILESSNNISDNTIYDDEIIITPNPFSNSFQIGLKNNIGDTIHISVSDITGKTVQLYDNRIIAETENTKIIINELSNISPGIYVINILINNKTEYSGKIIKG